MIAKQTRGRPSKLTPEIADRLVELLAGGVTVTAAAADLGVDRRTVQNWRRRAWSPSGELGAVVGDEDGRCHASRRAYRPRTLWSRNHSS
jgi:Homeodomain-like domain